MLGIERPRGIKFMKINMEFIVGILIGIIGIIITIIIGLFLNPIRDFFIEKWGRPLEIQPSSKEILFSANGNNWNEEFFVYLVNNTSRSYYGIQIFLEFPDSIDISIFPESSSEEFSLIGTKKAGIMVGPDFSINGTNKEKGTKVVETVINNIGPGEKKKIKVSIDKNNYNKNFPLEFQVSRFDKNPKPILNK